jgi:energy-coupling factor transporter ATP-binding protein EcfA2
VSSNLLVLDEVMDSSLDQDGTDEFMNIIQKLAAETNIIVISHKTTAMVDKFERQIRFEKKGNFSEMQVI